MLIRGWLHGLRRVAENSSWAFTKTFGTDHDNYRSYEGSESNLILKMVRKNIDKKGTEWKSIEAGQDENSTSLRFSICKIGFEVFLKNGHSN